LRGPSDATSEVAIVLDHFDEVSPHQRATVLVTLRQEGSRIVVYAVAPGSGASRDGLAPEDVIESIQGVKPLDVDDARDLLSGSLGSEVRLVVRRRGTKVAVFTSTEPFALKADAP
jgi:C-terminal processing protease CtpA/Prc